MDVKTYLLADYASIDASNKMNVIGVFGNISASSFPYTHPSMYLALSLKAELGEIADKRKLRIQLVGERGLEMANIEMDFEVPQSTKGRRPDLKIALGMQNMNFPEPGLYEFRIFIDKDKKAFLELEVTESSNLDH